MPGVETAPALSQRQDQAGSAKFCVRRNSQRDTHWQRDSSVGTHGNAEMVILLVAACGLEPSPRRDMAEQRRRARAPPGRPPDSLSVSFSAPFSTERNPSWPLCQASARPWQGGRHVPAKRGTLELGGHGCLARCPRQSIMSSLSGLPKEPAAASEREWHCWHRGTEKGEETGRPIFLGLATEQGHNTW